MSSPGEPPQYPNDDEQYDVVVPEFASAPVGPQQPIGLQQLSDQQAPGWTDTAWGAAPPPGYPAPMMFAPTPPKESAFTRFRRSMPTGLWWGLCGLVATGLVLILLVVAGVFSPPSPDEPGGTNQATGQYDPPSANPDRVRIVDKSAGISYDYLGDGWHDWQLSVMSEYQEVIGQYIITQPTTPDGSQFIAQVTSGLLSPTFGSPTSGGYAAALEAVEDSVRSNYYPQPNTPTNQFEEQLTIDGHAAYKRSMDLEWDAEGYDSTGERVVLLLIDTGKSDPVFFYCSFPNTHVELYPLIDEVIASILVDQ